MAYQVSAHGDERLALRKKRIPRTLLLFVMLAALTLLFLLLFFPLHNLVLGLVAIALTTMILFFAHFVRTDLDKSIRRNLERRHQSVCRSRREISRNHAPATVNTC